MSSADVLKVSVNTSVLLSKRTVASPISHSGYVCERKDLLVNGCCNVNAPRSRQYTCKSCLPNGCCSVYEYCVSCCLQPDKVTPLLSPESNSVQHCGHAPTTVATVPLTNIATFQHR